MVGRRKLSFLWTSRCGYCVEGSKQVGPVSSSHFPVSLLQLLEALTDVQLSQLGALVASCRGFGGQDSVPSHSAEPVITPVPAVDMQPTAAWPSGTLGKDEATASTFSCGPPWVMCFSRGAHRTAAEALMRLESLGGPMPDILITSGGTKVLWMRVTIG